MGLRPMITLADMIGAGAALCSMTSFVPQIVRIWRERDATSVSLKMYAVTVTGFALWIAYGAMSESWPLVLANLVCLIFAACILALKWRFSRDDPKPA